MVRQGFSTVLITTFLGLLTIFSISNNPIILAYEVTDQTSEGVFSSLSRNFDKTLEEINNDEKSIGLDDQDSSANTANSNDESDDQDSSANTANSNDESDDQDSSANTANSNDNSLRNSTLAPNSPNSNIEKSNSTDVADFESIDLASPII
ncbi:hypothetical protein [Candidatus Nitrosocosmicus hydrocola]|uniref:hypothetical protein n=1 Tax=Candidatus Nitrosocosmicus hydrocola TaxID=1826872 RepID=UPI0011E5F304|nr:hypothetical protein [Candidatus Nitrosocosmicus hydrocola]